MAQKAVRAAAQEGPVVTKATLGAAARLGLPNKGLARILGLSEARVSRMSSGSYFLCPSDTAFDLAVVFVRLFRSLDAVVQGDETVARAWLRNPNTALGATPLALIQSVAGLAHVVAYLDARRALA
jgi:hypothetical protein